MSLTKPSLAGQTLKEINAQTFLFGQCCFLTGLDTGLNVARRIQAVIKRREDIDFYAVDEQRFMPWLDNKVARIIEAAREDMNSGSGIAEFDP